MRPLRRNTFTLLGIGVALTLAGSLSFRAASPRATPSLGQARFNREVWKKRYVRPTSIPFPEDNRFTSDRELLGRTLFFDPRLSGSRWISCATCHNPGFSWGDGLEKGIGDGMKSLPRHTPTILNSAFGELMFWDGRATSLEEQASGPIQAAREMNQPLEKAVRNISSIPEYRRLFERAYRGESISKDTLVKAIATFERTLVSGQAPFDRWVSGDENAISEDAKSGFDLFNGKAACAKCHDGWNFSDDGFHDTGLPGSDPGRAKYLNLPSMQSAFKTPTLRNVDQRAPYMHDGSQLSLEQVIEFYDRGGEVHRPSLAMEIAPLHLTANEKRQLVAFLGTLTSLDASVPIPVLPR
jgi:cytochrome c peroxidase